MLSTHLLLLFLSILNSISSQLDLCEPSVSPSPACLCTRLDFMDTYSYRLRFGNSTFAGSNYRVTPPTVNSNYDCANEQLLQCGSSASGFAVFNMKYVLELDGRIPRVFCYPGIRMFDMDSYLVKQYQMNGDLPMDELDLHLTEVGCIEYGEKVDLTSKQPSTTSTMPSTVATTTPYVPEECTCQLPPPIMTQSEFNYRYAWQFPRTTYQIGTPEFVYSEGCQSVTMVCHFKVSSVLLNEKQSQKSLMFFNQEYMISGNDIRDVASRFNLHCDDDSATWRFDVASEEKFAQLLGVDSVDLSELGCATVTQK